MQPIIMVNLKEAVKIPTSKKKKKKVKTTKPKVNKALVDLRPSPLEVGDEVFALSGGRNWVRCKILKRIKPNVNWGQKRWEYETSETAWPKVEENIIPASILRQLPTNISKLYIPEFASALSRQFNNKALIFAAHVGNSNTPWGYYVIPDPEKLWKPYTWKHKNEGWGSVKEQTCCLFPVPASQLDIALMPINKAPSEILAYLGLHIYNGEWKRQEQRRQHASSGEV